MGQTQSEEWSHLQSFKSGKSPSHHLYLTIFMQSSSCCLWLDFSDDHLAAFCATEQIKRSMVTKSGGLHYKHYTCGVNGCNKGFRTILLLSQRDVVFDPLILEHVPAEAHNHDDMNREIGKIYGIILI